MTTSTGERGLFCTCHSLEFLEVKYGRTRIPSIHVGFKHCVVKLSVSATSLLWLLLILITLTSHLHAGLAVAPSFISYVIIVLRILSNKKQNLSIAGGQSQEESDRLNPQVQPANFTPLSCLQLRGSAWSVRPVGFPISPPEVEPVLPPASAEYGLLNE